MYKRFKKELRAVGDSDDDNSSELSDVEMEESSEDEVDITFVGERGDDDDDDVNTEDAEEGEVVTETDLEQGQEDPGAEYRCSLCPNKKLMSLDDVRKHLNGKVRCNASFMFVYNTSNRY